MKTRTTDCQRRNLDIARQFFDAGERKDLEAVAQTVTGDVGAI